MSNKPNNIADRLKCPSCGTWMTKPTGTGSPYVTGFMFGCPCGIVHSTGENDDQRAWEAMADELHGGSDVD